MSPSKPFVSAEEAWFWTVTALRARQQDLKMPKGEVRPCDPDDVIRALDGLYRQGRIGPDHARVLRRYGEQGVVPKEIENDRTLWDESMSHLLSQLSAKGIVVEQVKSAPTMSNRAIYRFINKSNNRVEYFGDPAALAAHMLGKRLSNILVIKSDDKGDRLVTFASPYVDAMEAALREA
jgi:hypothetical protein